MKLMFWREQELLFMDLTSVLILATRELIFVLSSWHTALFWIWYGNNVENTLMPWLLNDVYPKSWTFQFPRLSQWAGAQKAGRKHGQDSWPDQAKCIVHSTECHGQTKNWGGSPGRQTYHGLGMGLASVIRLGAIVLYNLFFLGLLPLWLCLSFFVFLPLFVYTLVLVSLLTFPSIPLRVQEGPEQLLYGTLSPAGVKLWQPGRYKNFLVLLQALKAQSSGKKA